MKIRICFKNVDYFDISVCVIVHYIASELNTVNLKIICLNNFKPFYLARACMINSNICNLLTILRVNKAIYA